MSKKINFRALWWMIYIRDTFKMIFILFFCTISLPKYILVPVHLLSVDIALVLANLYAGFELQNLQQSYNPTVNLKYSSRATLALDVLL